MSTRTLHMASNSRRPLHGQRMHTTMRPSVVLHPYYCGLPKGLQTQQCCRHAVPLDQCCHRAVPLDPLYSRATSSAIMQFVHCTLEPAVLPSCSTLDPLYSRASQCCHHAAVPLDPLYSRASQCSHHAVPLDPLCSHHAVPLDPLYSRASSAAIMQYP